MTDSDVVYVDGDARPRRGSDPDNFYANGTLTAFGLWNRGLNTPPPPQRPRGYVPGSKEVSIWETALAVLVLAGIGVLLWALYADEQTW